MHPFSILVPNQREGVFFHVPLCTELSGDLPVRPGGKCPPGDRLCQVSGDRRRQMRRLRRLSGRGGRRLGERRGDTAGRLRTAGGPRAAPSGLCGGGDSAALPRRLPRDARGADRRPRHPDGDRPGLRPALCCGGRWTHRARPRGGGHRDGPLWPALAGSGRDRGGLPNSRSDLYRHLLPLRRLLCPQRPAHPATAGAVFCPSPARWRPRAIPSGCGISPTPAPRCAGRRPGWMRCG